MADEEKVYGVGMPQVVETPTADFDGLVEDIKYKSQLLARETKLSSGVLATVSIGFAIGFLFAVLMMFGPFFVFKGGI